RSVGKQADAGADHHPARTERGNDNTESGLGYDAIHSRERLMNPGGDGRVVGHVGARLVAGREEPRLEQREAVLRAGWVAVPLETDAVGELDSLRRGPFVLGVEVQGVQANVRRLEERKRLGELTARRGRVHLADGEILDVV